MKERLAYMDTLRGLAVLLMVQQHLQTWLWKEKWFSYALTFHEHPFMIVMNFCGSFAAPLFLLVAGAGAMLMNEKENITGLSFVKRGVFLLACGYLLNILSPHWFSPCSWYILHTMGAALIVTPLLLRAGTPALLITAMVLFILPAFIQTYLSTPLVTGNSFMNSCAAKGGILRLALAEGHFPAAPWLSFFILGILSRRWLTENRPEKILQAGLLLFTLGGILAYMYAYGMFFATAGRFFRLFVLTLSIYPPHPPFIMMLAGTSLLLFFVFMLLKQHDNSLFIRLTVPIGRSSLSWFFIHIIIFNELLRITGLHSTFSATSALLIIILFMILMMIISAQWQKSGFRFSMEWLMKERLKL